MLEHLLTGTALGTALFAFYLEASPSIRDVWYRKNDEGEYEVQLENIKEYYKAPLMGSIFWYPQFWDINPYIFTASTTIVYIGLREIIT